MKPRMVEPDAPGASVTVNKDEDEMRGSLDYGG